jgi:branched-chain amino acid transport system substrate-binding protein
MLVSDKAASDLREGSMKNIFAAVVGGTAFALALGIAPLSAQETIKIGVALELSGRFVSFGAYCKNGVEYAAEQFGDKVAGRKVEFLYRDLQSEAPSTVSAFTELVSQSKVNYIIGPTASPIAAAAIGPWRAGKPIWIVPGASTTTMEKEVGAEPNFFHTFPYAYHYQATLSATFKHYLGSDKRVAILYVDDAYGRTHQPLARKYFTAAGFQIVDEEIIRTNSPDMNPVLTKIARSKPDILLGLIQTTDAVTLAKQVYTRNLKIPYLVGAASTQQKEWQDAVGEAQEGWIGLGTYLPNLVNWPANKDYPKALPSTVEWEKNFVAKFKREPNYDDLTCYVNTIQLLIAIDKAGGDDKEKVSAELAKLDIASPMGSTKFTKTEGGTLNQAFSDMLVFQRHDNKNVLLYPLSVAGDNKILKAPR